MNEWIKYCKYEVLWVSKYIVSLDREEVEQDQHRSI